MDISSEDASHCHLSIQIKVPFFKEEDDLFLKYIRWDTNMRMRYDNDFIDCHSRKISLGKCVDLKIGSKDPRNGSNIVRQQ